MTIGFSTKWPKSMGPKNEGKPNHFVEKIWQSFPDEVIHDRFTDYDEDMDNKGYDFNIDAVEMAPKIHTIRQDIKDRWKVGMKIHPVINNRTKDRFQFTPVMEVKSIQSIRITYYMGCGNWPTVVVDGRVLTHVESDKLARNDGFISGDQFFAWFNEDFEGKIISWVDHKY